MCRIWKMGRNLFSSLDIRDNFKVAFLEKNSNNPKIYLVTITVWGTGSVINWVNLSCWLPDLKVDIWQNLPKKCHFQIISHVQWWTNFFPFLHSAYQECMNFAKIGDGPCYYHWNEICAGVDMPLILVKHQYAHPTAAISKIQISLLFKFYSYF